MADESKITQEKVRSEHITNVNVGAHWAYLWGVFIGAFLLMVALIALLGSTAG